MQSLNIPLRYATDHNPATDEEKQASLAATFAAPLPPRSRMSICTHARAPVQPVVEDLILLERQLNNAPESKQAKVREKWRWGRGYLTPRAEQLVSNNLPPPPINNLPGCEDPAREANAARQMRQVQHALSEISQGNLTLEPKTWAARSMKTDDFSDEIFGLVLGRLQNTGVFNSPEGKQHLWKVWQSVQYDVADLPVQDVNRMRLMQYVLQLHPFIKRAGYVEARLD